MARSKVLRDILCDPLWYLNIQTKRIWRITAENTPVRLTIGGWWQDMPLPGWALAVLGVIGLLALAVTGHWSLFKILLFPLGTAVTPLLIYSGGGLHYYACFHLFIAALLFTWFFEWVFAVCFNSKMETRPLDH